MNKSILIVIASALLLTGGGGLAWFLNDRLTDAPATETGSPEYRAFVERLGGDEPAIRADLNYLTTSATVKFDAPDRERVGRLTRECLDARTLLDVDRVRQFVTATSPSAYHFVAPADRDRLKALAGESPSAERVLAIRKGLTAVANEFAVIRQPPDWHIKIEGEKPSMPFHDLMVDASKFLPPSSHPPLWDSPTVPAFAGPESELLAHLDRYFNGPTARAAFPPNKFPRLYLNGRIPPLPGTLAEYTQAIKDGIAVEKLILLPGEKADQEQVEAIDDIFARLERFFAAVAAAGQ